MSGKKINILIADAVNTAGLSEISNYKFKIHKNQNLDNDGIIRYSLKKNINVLIINSGRQIDRNFLSRCPFRAIATASRGTDHIDIDYAQKRNIKILNSISGNSVAAAEHTIALMLAIYKNLFLSDSNVRNGNFRLKNFRLRNLMGKKIGIIGFGQVGSKVGSLAKALGMNVGFYDINPEIIKRYRDMGYMELDNIFKKCDFITIHIPLNSHNKCFIGRKHFSLMKNGSVFINTSRGGVINEKEMLKFAKQRPDVGFGLDVFLNEPDIDKDFRKLKNAVLTNHIAGKTEESVKFISEEIFKQVNKLFC